MILEKINDYLSEETKKILNLLTDGIIITDSRGIVQFINDSYAKYANLLPEDIVGKYLKDVRPGARLPEALQKKKALYNVPRKEGPVESYVDAIPIIEDDKLIGGMALTRDTKTLKIFMNYLKNNNEKMRQELFGSSSSFSAKYTFEDFIGNKEAGYILQAKKAAASNSPVLICGESGTGKELIAQAIHNASSRFRGPFVDINCGALPDALLESELFGYTPGSFTGAHKAGKIGLFETADAGTIFLDEITEMPLNLQVKLLRVLQEKSLRRLGDNKNTSIDIRIIAATNINIFQAVQQKQFRQDLFYRLAVFVINLPPLRERKNDLPNLIHHFISQNKKLHSRSYTMTDNCLNMLIKHNWPGNIRELQNVIEYACNVTDDNIIDLNDIPKDLIKINDINDIKKCSLEEDLKSSINRIEKNRIERYLEIYGRSLQSKKRIAKELNISLATLYNKLKKYHINC